MSTFAYKAVDFQGKSKSGSLNANTEQEVIQVLRERNLIPVEIKSSEVDLKSLMSIELTKKKVKLVDLSVFCRQLSTMLKAGLPLDRAITVQIRQTESPAFRQALAKVDKDIRAGRAMSKAMAEQKDVFPQILVNMVESGEMTGSIDQALSRMAVHFEKENAVNRKIKGAMIYPIVLLILTLGVATGLIVFVIPTFSAMFEEAGSELPGLTQFMVNLSNAMRTHWYLFLGGAFLIVFSCRRFVKSKKGREIYDKAKLKLPVIKKPMTQIITARFTRTMSTMLASGISILYALDSAGETTNNVMVTKGITSVSDDMKKGASMAEQLRRLNIFPEMMLSMIGIGEETGALDEMMEKTANYYDEEFDSAVQKMLSLLEPLMIIIMAAVVGVIVMAMYLPLFGIYDTLA